MKLLHLNWVQSLYEDDPEGLAALEAKAKGAGPLLELIVQWAVMQQAALDSQMKLTNLKDKPDRAELALMCAAQKEVLDNLINLLDK